MMFPCLDSGFGRAVTAGAGANELLEICVFGQKRKPMIPVLQKSWQNMARFMSMMPFLCLPRPCLYPYAGTASAGLCRACPDGRGKCPEKSTGDSKKAGCGGWRSENFYQAGCLKHLISRVDHLILGGGMANTFLAAQGYEMAGSLMEADLVDIAKNILKSAERMYYPSAKRRASEFKRGRCTYHCKEALAKDEMMLDIGPEAIASYSAVIREVKTVLWNGPMGAFEIPPFDAGTNGRAQYVADCTADGLVSIAGGGDTVAALNHAGCADKFGYISLAGGHFWNGLKGANCRIAILDSAPRSGERSAHRVFSQTIKGLCAMFLPIHLIPPPEAEEALKGRAAAIMTPGRTQPMAVLLPRLPEDVQLVQLGLGCFLGPRATILDTEGSIAGCWLCRRAHSKPTYEVCSGQTGRSEVVLVAFQPDILSFEALLAIFGKAMTQHKAIVREMILARNIALLSTHHLLKCWRRRALPVILARN